MSSGSSKDALDDAFQKIVIQMKPHVLQCTNEKENRLIRAWIKKLCSETIFSITERKNRNLYALLLLKMLHNDSLDEPFTTLPVHGVLPTIPAYIVDHLSAFNGLSGKKKICLEPSWLHDDSFLQDSLLSVENNMSVYKDIFSPKKRERFMLSSHFLDKNIHTNDNLKQTTSYETKYTNDNDANELYSYLDEDIETNKVNTDQIENGKKTSEKKDLPKTEKSGMKDIDGKVHEATLQIQQQHDQMVEKILERKNNEITDIKKFCQLKIDDLEKITKDQESKINALTQELSSSKSAHRHAIDNLKKSEKKATELEKEYEKILYDKLSGFESEMYELQRSHRENIHQVVNEAENKINSMKYQMETDNNLLKEEIRKCNDRLISQAQAIENVEKENYKYKREQQEYKDVIEKQKVQIEECSTKLQQQQKQARENEKLQQKCVDELNEKNELISHLQKEQELLSLKKSSAISSLEEEINLLKETIDSIKLNEKESKVYMNQEIVKLQLVHKQQIILMSNDFENKTIEYENKLKKNEIIIAEKEEEIKKLVIKLDSHISETNNAIESFKKKAEEDSNSMFNELSLQLENLQSLLSSSKQKIEENKVEYNKRFEEQKYMYEKQIEDYKRSFEFEKSQLKELHEEQKSNLLKQMENQSSLQEQMLKSWKEEENKYKDQSYKHQKAIEDMESQVRSLRVEVIQANTLRKEQIQEIGLLRKEEQEAAKRNEESLHSKYKNEIDEINLHLQREHSIQLNSFTQKMNEQLKNIESEYTKKTVEDHDKIASLKRQLSAANKKLSEYEMQLQESIGAVADERKKLLEYQNQSLLKHEELEDHYQNLLLKAQEKLSHCRQEYESKLKGMLSQSVQQDLEDTIVALREQLQIMQARANILQEELNVNQPLGM